MTDKQKLAAITLNKGEKLEGFKILWLFPFFVKHIGFSVQIEICEIRDKLREIKGNDNDITMNDFYNTQLLKKSKKLIFKLITVALVNGKWYNRLMYPFLYAKVKDCNNIQLNMLYKKILELSNADFFLACYRHMTTADHTILKED